MAFARVALFAGALALNATSPADTPGRHAPAFVYSPYKHITIAMNAQTHVISTAVGGTPVPLVAPEPSALPPGVATVTLAFATGECGDETWEGLDAQMIADANLSAFNAAAVSYIVSTGGAEGVFTCATDAGMERFIARYASPRLIGIDFDIEGSQTPEAIDSLVARVKAAQRRHPGLRFSFTLATFAATDGSRASLNNTGMRVMKAIRARGLTGYYVNLMVMDYGDATAVHCVVSEGRCDMGRSAIQAARNLNRMYGVPLARIELTPMIGVNDVVANVFTLDDASLVARYVRDHRLGGLHFWSLDRDTRCAGDAKGVSSTCSSLDAAPFAFTRAFNNALQ